MNRALRHLQSGRGVVVFLALMIASFALTGQTLGQNSPSSSSKTATSVIDGLEGKWRFELRRPDSTLIATGTRTFRRLTPTVPTLVWTERFESGLEIGGLFGFDTEQERFWEVGVAPDAPVDMTYGLYDPEARTIAFFDLLAAEQERRGQIRLEGESRFVFESDRFHAVFTREPAQSHGDE